jgi:hypothetical protein
MTGTTPPPAPTVAGPARSKLADRMAKPLKIQTKAEPPSPGKGRDKVMRIKRLEAGQRFEDLYQLAEGIYDAGSKGKVVHATEKASGHSYVVKMRMKSHFRGSEAVWRDITEKIMNMDRCVHVLDFHEILEDDDAYYVVMERVNTALCPCALLFSAGAVSCSSSF